MDDSFFDPTPELDRKTRVVQIFMERALSKAQQRELAAMVQGKRAYFVFPKDESEDLVGGSDLPVLPVLRLRAIARIFQGEVVSYKSENGAKLLRWVTPKDAVQVGSQGEKELPYHTDMGYLRFPTEAGHPQETSAPDFLVLTCIRNEEKTPTYLFTLKDIKAQLSKKALRRLRDSAYDFESPDSVQSKPPPSLAVPVLKEHSGYGDMIRWEKCSPNKYGTQENVEAHKEIEDTLDKLRLFTDRIVLEPGQTLVFNNRQLVHGRPEIKKGVGQRRTLVRVYLFRKDTEQNPEPGQALYVQNG